MLSIQLVDQRRFTECDIMQSVKRTCLPVELRQCTVALSASLRAIQTEELIAGRGRLDEMRRVDHRR